MVFHNKIELRTIKNTTEFEYRFGELFSDLIEIVFTVID